MKLPAVAIAASFGCGAVLGQAGWFAQAAASHFALSAAFVVSGLLVGFGMFLAVRGYAWSASGLSLCAWLLLGFLGSGIANQPRRTDHVLSLLETRQLQLGTPLCWHGQLRDEPALLPWGYSYEMELSGVEYQGALVPARGGLRASYTPEQEQTLPDVHAGDQVAVTVQAKLPQVFRDEGAFDRRAYLAQQNIHLTATLRAAQLMERSAPSCTTVRTVLARARKRLRDEVDTLFESTPETAAVLRAMLLGDRSFVERDVATDFQKTGVFHILVVAGLHVGAFVVFLLWVGRKLSFPPLVLALTTLVLLLAYVAVIEDRAPVVRAALMAAILLLGRFFFRRLDLLNSTALAALILLVANPLAIRDSSFQLTFLALACIAGLAMPWLETNVQPYTKALRGWRDATRDASHEPRAAQFRLDVRATAHWLAAKAPARLRTFSGNAFVRGIGFSVRACELLVLTLTLQVGMLPIMVLDFHRVTFSAPLVNLAAVPLTGVVVPLGFLTLASGFFFHSVARVLSALLAIPVSALLRLVHWFAAQPRWSYRVPGPPTWLIVLFFAAALALCVVLRLTEARFRWARRTGAATLAACAVAIALFPFSPQRSTGKLELTVLDVGQGDSLFVVSPHGKTLLVDGGGAFAGFSGREQRHAVDPGEEAISPYLWSRGFKRLDVVALTHAHQDHIGGLAAVLDNFKIGALWIGREVSSPALANLERIAVEKKIPITHELRGNAFAWDDVAAQFLWPETASSSATERGPQNNDSLVLRLQFGDRSMLLAGDAEKQAENSMLSENKEPALRADVLKVGHHGSKNSSTASFLAAVHPQVALISAGEGNPYGHPNPELLARLEAAGAHILRTDRDGAIHIQTDGNHLTVSCFLPCNKPPARSTNLQAQSPQR